MADGGARNDYLSRVYRHIDPHRDYPAAARAARQHGRVVTRVTINRDGELLDVRLDRSSGWPLIDDAEMAAIRRAMPLPPVPDGMPRRSGRPGPADELLTEVRLSAQAKSPASAWRTGARHHGHVAVVGVVEADHDIAVAACERPRPAPA